MQDETILVEQPIHWKNYIMPLLSIVLCLTAIFIRGLHKEYSIVNDLLSYSLIPTHTQIVLSKVELVILGLLILGSILKMLSISYIRYYLTNKRVIYVSGIIQVTSQEVLIEKIEMIYLNQNAYERIFGCGDILCVTAGAPIFLDDVKNAVAFKQTVLQQMSRPK